MHCSIWCFKGDPVELERAYLSLVGDVPESSQVLHLGARTPEGFVIVDTCPSKEVFDDFFSRESVVELFASHGLDLATAERRDYPVTAAFARRARIDGMSWDAI